METDKPNNLIGIKHTKRKRKRKLYSFWFSDDFGDGGGSFGEDGGRINGVQVDVG